MTNLIESSTWESGIYQLETDDPTLGGQPGFNMGEPVTGHANAQAQQLANRTSYLKNRIDVDLANTTDPSKGAGMVGFKQAGTEAVARTAYDKLKEFVSVKDFGAVGDGITDDTNAIRAAIAHCKATGSNLEADGKDTYYLGTFQDTIGEVKFVLDFNNFEFKTNNCKFIATYNPDPALAASSKMTIIKIVDAVNITLGDFIVEADYCERTLTQQGITGVWISNEAANSRNILINSITGYRLLSNITVSSSDPALYRCRSIHVTKSVNDGGYYNIICSDNGDALTANIYSNDLVRSYFVYGVRGHNVNVYSTNHLKFTDVLVKRYEFNTEDIYVNYNCPSDLSSNASVSIEHQNASDNGVIRDIRIHLNVVKSNPANPTLNFVSYNELGVVRTTTSSITDNISISGNSNSTVPTTIQSIISGVNGENISRLMIQKKLISGINDFKRFIVYESMNKLIARGDASTNMTIKFNVSEFKFTPNWGVLTVWGADNPSASSAEYIIRQYFVLFTVPSSGSTTIGTNTIVATQTTGSLGVTVTFPAQTNTFNFEINVNNYINAGRQCSASLEIFRFN